MAQGSGFWDNNDGGDADGTVLFTSPYNHAERALWFSLLMASGSARAYVLGGVDNSLEVKQAGTPGMSVIVRSGKMFFRGYMYANDGDEPITIDAADATNPRIDLIVATITFADQEIRLDVVKGTAAATPSRPVLTQGAVIYQEALAEIWIPASSSTVTDPFIHDLRNYLPNVDALGNNRGYPDNMIMNSELMAANAQNGVPGYQRVSSSGSVASTAALARATQHSRGNMLATTPAASLLEGWTTVGIPVVGGATYTIKTLIQAFTGNTSGSEVVVASDGTGALDIHKKYFLIGVWEECQITFTVPNDATLVGLSWRSLGLGKITVSGASMMVRGYYTGPWRQFRETLLFPIPATDTSWDGDAKSSGNTTITLGPAGSFSGMIPNGVRGLIVYIEANDSGSAAGVASLKVGQTTTSLVGSVLLDGVVNDKVRSEQCFVPVSDPGVFAPSFAVVIVATGAGTLDANLKIVGVLT